MPFSSVSNWAVSPASRSRAGGSGEAALEEEEARSRRTAGRITPLLSQTGHPPGSRRPHHRPCLLDFVAEASTNRKVFVVEVNPRPWLLTDYFPTYHTATQRLE